MEHLHTLFLHHIWNKPPVNGKQSPMINLLNNNLAVISINYQHCAVCAVNACNKQQQQQPSIYLPKLKSFTRTE